jgi:F-type H+-transporting ATPase subunit b
MQKKDLLKRLLILVMLLSFAMPIPAAMAQDDAEGETTTEEVVEDAHSEGEDHGGEEEGGLLTPLGINSGLLFTQTFNFILMAVILSVVLWRPMVNFLDSRSAKIQKGLEDAAAAAKARQNAEAEAEKIRQEARAEVAKTLEEARQRGDEVAKQIETAANAEAEKIKTDAAADAKTARDAELAGLRDQVLSISVAMAGKILGENLDEKKSKALADKFFSDLPADAKGMSGAIEVVSAMPLTDAEQANAKKALGSDDVTFVVDPAILGGIIVRGQEKVVDGSIRSSLNDLSGRIK